MVAVLKVIRSHIHVPAFDSISSTGAFDVSITILFQMESLRIKTVSFVKISLILSSTCAWIVTYKMCLQDIMFLLAVGITKQAVVVVV